MGSRSSKTRWSSSLSCREARRKYRAPQIVVGGLPQHVPDFSNSFRRSSVFTADGQILKHKLLKSVVRSLSDSLDDCGRVLTSMLPGKERKVSRNGSSDRDEEIHNKLTPFTVSPIA